MVQRETRVKPNDERVTSPQERMARGSARAATRVENARKTREQASGLEGLSYRGGARG